MDFDHHQQGLHKRTDSKFPKPPTIPELPGISGNFPVKRIELNRTEPNRIEKSGARAPDAPTAPTLESKPRKGQGNGAFGARALPREHLSHEVCGARICLPRQQFFEFVGKCGTGLDEQDVRAWAEAITVEWSEPPKCDETIRGTVFQFWSARWEEWQGPAGKPQNRGDDTGPVKQEWVCTHTPHCGSHWRCHQTTQLAEAREAKRAR